MPAAVLMGPSGCGKSTLLAEMAQALIAPPPAGVDKDGKPIAKAPTPCECLLFSVC